MADFEIQENPEYTEAIRKFEVTDPAHAELLNPIVQTLINNETFLKKLAENHLYNEENPHNVTKNHIGLGNVNNTADANKHVNSAGHLRVLNDNYRQGTDLPSTYPQGEVIFFSNNPPTARFNEIPYCTIHTIKGYSNMACIQFLYPYNTDHDKIYFREALYNTDSWRPWYEVITSKNISSQSVNYATSANGIEWQAGTDNVSRHVWFSNTSSTMELGRPVYDSDFKYNPSTNTLTVGSITGNAASATKATQDGNGNDIASTYAKQSRFNGRSLALCESSNASGEGSLALGYTTKAIGTTSTALGYFANVSGANAISIGSFTNASGSISVALGDHAAARGIDSVALGEHTEAQYRYASAVGGHAKARAEHSTALGYFANVSGNSSTALGEYAATSNANSIQLGNASRLSSITARVAITVTSDERDKADITEMDSKALDFLKKVKAIRYVFNSRELYIDEENLSDEERKNKEKYGLCAYDREEHAKGTKKGNRIRAGVSAQNVLQALKEVYGDSSYANLVNDNFFDLNKDEIPEGVENQLAVNYEGFIPFLIKAVQELSARLEALESKNGEDTE